MFPTVSYSPPVSPHSQIQEYVAKLEKAQLELKFARSEVEELNKIVAKGNDAATQKQKGNMVSQTLREAELQATK